MRKRVPVRREHLSARQQPEAQQEGGSRPCLAIVFKTLGGITDRRRVVGEARQADQDIAVPRNHSLNM